jgi:DNA repair photolyase
MGMIGITERGDAGLHFDWVERLDEVDFAVLVTKSLNERFVEAVARRPDKVVVHVTCTGLGGSAVEPKVPEPGWTRARYDRLVEVLPPERTVLRVDPVAPTTKGLEAARSVLALFADSPVRRVRFSLLDAYPHVAVRFDRAGVPHPYGGAFQPSRPQREAAAALFAAWEGRYEIESCAEAGPWQLGCVSSKDAALCGRADLKLGGSSGQRKGCLCPAVKLELLRRRAAPCAHGCLYCYWKD